MRRLLQCALLLLVAAGLCRAGERIDGIVATVNGTAILQSDWDEAVRYEALLNLRLPAQTTPEERAAVLQRLIDQELLRQQMGKSYAPPASDVAARLAQLRAQYPGAQSDDGWHKVLTSYLLTESDVAERLTVQLQIMSFVDMRLRSEVHVDAAAVEAYYGETLLPKFKQAGTAELPLAQVADQIRAILVQQQLDALLSSYLHDLRQQSRIRIGAEAVSAHPSTPPTRKHTGWVSVTAAGGR